MFCIRGCQQLKDALPISSRGFSHCVHKICVSKASIETSYRFSCVKMSAKSSGVCGQLSLREPKNILRLMQSKPSWLTTSKESHSKIRRGQRLLPQVQVALLHQGVAAGNRSRTGKSSAHLVTLEKCTETLQHHFPLHCPLERRLMLNPVLDSALFLCRRKGKHDCNELVSQDTEMQCDSTAKT